MSGPTRDPRAEALALASLFVPDGLPPPASPPSLEELRRFTDARLSSLGIARPAPLALDEDDAEDPRELLYWLVRMAEETYARLLEPPLPAVDPALVARLEALLASRPAIDEEHCQMPIDAESVLRRAAIAIERARSLPGPIVAVGDDDGVSVALALLGAEEVHALDIDERVLEHHARAAHDAGGHVEVHRVDLFEDPLPPALEGECSVAITDPIRSYGPCLAFLSFAAACLRPHPEASLLWADHPEWNFELDRVLAALPDFGLRRAEVRTRVHRYPITAAWVPDPAEKARALGVPEAWLRALVARTSGVTHLYVLTRA